MIQSLTCNFRRDDLSSELENLKVLLDDGTGDFSDARKDLSDAKKRLDDRKIEIKALQKKITKLEKKKTEFEKDAHNLKAVNDDVLARLRECRAQLDEQTEKSGELIVQCVCVLQCVVHVIA